MSKIVKLAVIRDNENAKCPFGLPVPFGCKYAGNVVERMAPTSILKEASEQDEQKIASANVKLLSWSLMEKDHVPAPCMYASKVFKEAVECNYEDVAPGESGTIAPIPDYSQIFSGDGFTGLYSWPIGHYADYNISRNLFYGQFSLQSSEEQKDIVKEDVEQPIKKHNDR